MVANWIKGGVPEEFLDEFLRGECCLKNPIEACGFIEEIPVTDIPAEYVVYKPLSKVNLENETPISIVFSAIQTTFLL